MSLPVVSLHVTGNSVVPILTAVVNTVLVGNDFFSRTGIDDDGRFKSSHGIR
jgi:hypothetical protein